MKQRLLIIGSISVVVLGLTVAGLLSGRLYVGLKDPRQTLQLRREVCAELIERYNKGFEGREQTFSDQSLTALGADISGRAGHQQDATCMYMLTSVYLLRGDKAKATEALKGLRQLAERGETVSLKLRHLESVEQLAAVISMKEGETHDPGGERVAP